MATRFRFISVALISAALLLISACTEAGPTDVIAAGGFIAVTTGANHSCALTVTGLAYCWGSDVNAQLGTRGQANSATAVRPETQARFNSISAGDDHTCALDSTGQLYCWGNNNHGQLGNGTTVTLITPVILAVGQSFVAISTGARHTCALAASGLASCWGAGGQGQLGAGRFRSELSRVTVAGSVRFSVISAGHAHTCGLALDGAAYCWGQNTFGQLGNGSIDNAEVPFPVAGGRLYQSISAGENHSCAIDRTGVAYCWGSSEYGEGGGTVTLPGQPSSLVPVRVFGPQGYSQISAGAGFSCGISEGTAGSCWGRGWEGQLGTGQLRNWNTPQIVSDGQGRPPFLSISARGRTHACGLTVGNAVYCWGKGDFGQLGNPVTSFSPLAVRVPAQ